VLRHNLSEFMGSVFTENAHEENPLLRGCYFTSGTQEGSPIDRLMNAMSEAFGIRQSIRRPADQTGETKSYFLRELFSNVVFPEETLAVRGAKEQQRQQSLRLAYAGGALAVALCLTLLPLVSFFRNRSMVVGIRDRAEELTKDAPASAPASAV